MRYVFVISRTDELPNTTRQQFMVKHCAKHGDKKTKRSGNQHVDIYFYVCVWVLVASLKSTELAYS